MFLDYIDITNYRRYYGTQRISFDYSSEENLSVILADNGSGKTSLVNALTWCLYGKELHDIKNRSEPLYNLKYAHELEEQSDINSMAVNVELNFHYFDEENNRKNLKISRQETYYRSEDNQWTASFYDDLFVDETDKEILENELAQDRIDDKIPEDMFQYFFFNGATLSNYFKNESETNLRKSVEEISQIDLINKVKDHLEKTLSYYNSEYSKIKPKGITNYNAEIQEKKNQKRNFETKKENNYEKIDNATSNIDKYEKELEKVDKNSINLLTSERKKLENEVVELKDIIRKNTFEYENTILELFPIVILFDDIVKAYKIADEARKNKTAPPKIERQLLNDILDDGSCICGIKLDEHPECIEELKKRLKNTSNVDKETFYDEYYKIQNLLSKLNRISDIDHIKNDINQDKNNLKEKNIKIDEITEKIKNFNMDNVKIYEKELAKNKAKRESLRNENESLTNKIETLENDISRLETKRNEEKTLQGDLKELNNKIEFSEIALDEVNNLNKQVQKHIREKITKQTKKQFTSMNWAYKKYVDVDIAHDYQIKITKNSGDIVKPSDLSDGEENLLALSFMMALHSLNGFEIPLIIDAPLEKLDKSKRLEFIKGLHEYTANKQIVFLFTDSQYTPDVRNEMLNHVSNEYELVPYDNWTEIVKHE